MLKALLLLASLFLYTIQDDTRNTMAIISPPPWVGVPMIKESSDKKVTSNGIKHECGPFIAKIIKKKVNYDEPFDFVIKGYTKSKTGKCKLKVIGNFLIEESMKDIHFKEKKMWITPENKTLDRNGYFPCNENEMMQIRLSKDYNCEICNINFVYKLDNDPKFKLRQCFSV